MKKFDLEKIRDYILNEPSSSKIYIGTDSTTRKKNGDWIAEFYTVVVVHKGGRHGCKIFGEVTTEKMYNYDKKRPKYRLMQECYKASAAYLELAEVIGDRDCEIHLDLNPDEKHISSIAVAEAIGYIKGTCNIIPMVKPNAFAASYAADRIGRVSSL
jgi:Uncharacterized protein conserved in bacteria